MARRAGAMHWQLPVTEGDRARRCVAARYAVPSVARATTSRRGALVLLRATSSDLRRRDRMLLSKDPRRSERSNPRVQNNLQTIAFVCLRPAGAAGSRNPEARARAAGVGTTYPARDRNRARHASPASQAGDVVAFQRESCGRWARLRRGEPRSSPRSTRFRVPPSDGDAGELSPVKSRRPLAGRAQHELMQNHAAVRSRLSPRLPTWKTRALST